MSDNVWLAIIAGIVTLLTPVMAQIARVLMRMEKKVDGRLDQLLANDETLRNEISRLNAGGAPSPTTRQSGGPSVTERDGVVTIEKKP